MPHTATIRAVPLTAAVWSATVRPATTAPPVSNYLVKQGTTWNDELQQPQTMLRGNRFCRDCVVGMQEFGVIEARVIICPLCCGPMPNIKCTMLASSRHHISIHMYVCSCALRVDQPLAKTKVWLGVRTARDVGMIITMMTRTNDTSWRALISHHSFPISHHHAQCRA